MLSSSRFNRRLHGIGMLLNDLFHQIGKNSKRQDELWNKYVKQGTRHYIETVFSAIICLFPKSNRAASTRSP